VECIVSEHLKVFEKFSGYKNMFDVREKILQMI